MLYDDDDDDNDDDGDDDDIIQGPEGLGPRGCPGTGSR